MLLGEDFAPYNKLFQKHYQSITKKEVYSVIKKYFKKENMSVCLLGAGIPSLETIKRVTERFLG
jgi:predicted Zn-dependent peptidase